MKKAQITKLLANVGAISISGAGENWEIETETENGKRNVCRVLRAVGVNVGGYKCGYGGWMLTPSFQLDATDINSTSAKCHY